MFHDVLGDYAVVIVVGDSVVQLDKDTVDTIQF